MLVHHRIPRMKWLGVLLLLLEKMLVHHRVTRWTLKSSTIKMVTGKSPFFSISTWKLEKSPCQNLSLHPESPPENFYPPLRSPPPPPPPPTKKKKKKKLAIAIFKLSRTRSSLLLTDLSVSLVGGGVELKQKSRKAQNPMETLAMQANFSIAVDI